MSPLSAQVCATGRVVPLGMDPLRFTSVVAHSITALACFVVAVGLALALTLSHRVRILFVASLPLQFRAVVIGAFGTAWLLTALIGLQGLGHIAALLIVFRGAFGVATVIQLLSAGVALSCASHVTRLALRIWRGR